MEDMTSLQLRLTTKTKYMLDEICNMEYCSLNYQLIALVMKLNPATQFNTIKHKENKTVDLVFRLPTNLKDKLLITAQKNRMKMNGLIDVLIQKKYNSIQIDSFMCNL